MEGVHHITLFSHTSDSSPSHVTDDLVTAFDHLGIKGPHRTDEGVDALEYMSFTDPWKPITSLDTETSSSPVDVPSTNPIQYPMDSPPVNSHICISQPSHNKQENNVLTMHALKTLTDIERLMQTCQTVERVTHSTPSIDTLKEKVV